MDKDLESVVSILTCRVDGSVVLFVCCQEESAIVLAIPEQYLIEILKAPDIIQKFVFPDKRGSNMEDSISIMYGETEPGIKYTRRKLTSMLSS
jgi:hypothetical protein